jgi:hypothetical protein
MRPNDRGSGLLINHAPLGKSYNHSQRCHLLLRNHRVLVRMQCVNQKHSSKIILAGWHSNVSQSFNTARIKWASSAATANSDLSSGDFTFSKENTRHSPRKHQINAKAGWIDVTKPFGTSALMARLCRILCRSATRPPHLLRRVPVNCISLPGGAALRPIILARAHTCKPCSAVSSSDNACMVFDGLSHFFSSARCDSKLLIPRRHWHRASCC